MNKSTITSKPEYLYAYFILIAQFYSGCFFFFKYVACTVGFSSRFVVHNKCSICHCNPAMKVNLLNTPARKSLDLFSVTIFIYIATPNCRLLSRGRTAMEFERKITLSELLFSLKNKAQSMASSRADN